MDLRYESDIIIGIITKHCIKDLYHEELDAFFKEISSPISSTCVKSIDLFAGRGMTQKRIDEFDEYTDVADLKLTILLKRDTEEYILFTFLIHTYDDGEDSEFNLNLVNTEIFNIPIAEELEYLIKNCMINHNISDFTKRHMKSKGYNKLFIRDTFGVDFSALDKINSSLEWIEGFIKNKGYAESKRFLA